MTRPADGYGETPEGLVFFADGLNPVARWDGIAAQTYPVGVTAPATALAIAVNPAVPDPRPAAPLTGCSLIKDPAATAPSLPTTPAAPTVARDSSRDQRFAGGVDPSTYFVTYPSGSALKGSYTCAMRVQDDLGNWSQWSALSAALVVTRVDNAGYPPNTFALKYTGIPVGASNVVRRQIAINANLATSAANNVIGAGDTSDATYHYLDIDTTDVSSTSLISNEAITRTGALRRLASATRVDLSEVSVPVSFTGNYFAYVRFYDAEGRFSDFSPISPVLALEAADLAYGFRYEDVPVPTDPAVVGRQILRNAAADTTTFYVDIDTDDLVATDFTSDRTDADLAGQSQASDDYRTPGIAGTYSAYSRFVNERGAYSDLSPLSDELTIAEDDYVYGLTYTSVPVPTQANVVRRQILRNTAGQADTYYVDVDTTDLAATTFGSTRSDSDLSSQEAAPLFAGDDTPIANTRGVPPSHKTAMIHHSGRMFMAVDRVVSSERKGGGVVVTNGSTAVTGLNTQWTSSMAGRFFWVKGATRSYEIDSVDASAQTLVLTEAYEDTTDLFATYSIRPAPAERRLVYYTQAGEPESWPAFNALSLQEDGDEITGLMCKDSFVYFIEAKHIYKFTFQSDPAVDGFVYLAVNRGCLNNRCWVLADGVAYCLDYSGVHAFDGSDDAKSVSDPIQNLFSDNDDGPKLHWPAAEAFHAAHYPDERFIRWFVCLSGETAPRHALCLDYDDKRWWIEEYDRPVTSSATGVYRFRRRVFAGSDAGQCFLTQEGRLDGLQADSGTTRGRVGSASLYRLDDPAASWPAGLTGKSVTIVQGKGVGQRRRIASASGTSIVLRDPWNVLPDSTSVYQLGGIGWAWKSGWLRFAPGEDDIPRRVEVLYEPTRPGQLPAVLRLRISRDFTDSPVVWEKTTKAASGEGFAATKDSPDLVADMSQPRGYAQQRMGGHKELNMEGNRFVAVTLAGVSSEDEQAIYSVGFDGVKG